MPVDRAVFAQVNKELNRVLGAHPWSSELNFVPINAQSVRAFQRLLQYVDMLQKQVKGLEETIRKLR